MLSIYKTSLLVTPVHAHIMTGRLYLFLLLCLLVSFLPCSAHESCCKFKLGAQNQEPVFIDDPADSPPNIWEGQLRFVDDTNDLKPDDWDDEDDGDWAPVMVLNPNYSWKPRQIPNPANVPPPTYWDKLLVEIQAALPWVTLGVLVTGVLSVNSLPMDRLVYWLHESDGESSVFMKFQQLLSAALLGLATPLCSCGALPLCAGLFKQGVPLASALAYLTASQSGGLDSSAITYGLLGSQAMLGRLLGSVVLAIAVGLACPTDNRKQKKVSEISEAKSLNGMGHTATAFVGVLSSCIETATEICPTVFLGLVLSTAALHYLPSLISHVNSSGYVSTQQDFWMRSLLLVSAVPLQLCEHTSVTLASAIHKAGGSPGLAFAFLLSAPAMNLPSILWIWSLGDRAGLGLILLTLCTTALVLSYVVDGFNLDLLAGESTGEKANLPDWLADSSPFLCGSMVAAGWYRKFKRSHSPVPDDTCHTCCDQTSEQAKGK
jgi:hypothetical protein